MSETLFISTNYPQNDKPGTVGKLIEQVNLSFSEDNEILVYVPWIFKGFFPNEQNFESYATGDIGKLENGFLTILDRKKNLIIKGGLNLSPKRIENYIQNYKIFEDCVIFGVEDRFLTEKTICFYISKNMINKEELKQINQKITKDLGIDYIIDEFVSIKTIPKTLNGKINKIKLITRYKESQNVS